MSVPDQIEVQLVATRAQLFKEGDLWFDGGDDVCDGIDICLEGDDNVDLDGNGTPDACDGKEGTGECSCATTSPSGGWLVPLLALTLIRRRK